jgi:hypothetical protein
MKNASEALISELMSQLNKDEQNICQRVIGCLSGLGYVPHKENVKNFVLSFKNRGVGQTIAKLGLRSGKNNGVFYSIKFYACKNPPEKFTNAVREAVIRSKGQYACSDCGICGAGEGERGYRCLLPDGTAFLRCGAYVVEIPDLTAVDAEDFNKLLIEQHGYFTERTK